MEKDKGFITVLDLRKYLEQYDDDVKVLFSKIDGGGNVMPFQNTVLDFHEDVEYVTDEGERVKENLLILMSQDVQMPSENISEDSD